MWKRIEKECLLKQETGNRAWDADMELIFVACVPNLTAIRKQSASSSALQTCSCAWTIPGRGHWAQHPPPCGGAGLCATCSLWRQAGPRLPASRDSGSAQPAFCASACSRSPSCRLAGTYYPRCAPCLSSCHGLWTSRHRNHFCYLKPTATVAQNANIYPTHMFCVSSMSQGQRWSPGPAPGGSARAGSPCGNYTWPTLFSCPSMVLWSNHTTVPW